MWIWSGFQLESLVETGLFTAHYYLSSGSSPISSIIKPPFHINMNKHRNDTFVSHWQPDTVWSHTIPGISLLSIFSLGELLGWVVGRCQSTIKVPDYSRIKRNHPFCAIFSSGEFRGNLTSIHFKNSFERRWKCFVPPMVPKWIT